MGIVNMEKHLVQCQHCKKDVLDHMTECPFCKGELKPKYYDPRSKGNYTSGQKTIRTIVWGIAILSIVFLIVRNFM